MPNLFKKLFILDDTPHRIAGGAAVGVFMGIIPFEGVTASLIVTTLLGYNRTAGVLAVAIANVWATLITLIPAAFFGGFIFNIDAALLIDNFFHTFRGDWDILFIKELFWKIALPLMVGYIIVGALAAIATYFLCYTALRRRIQPTQYKH